MLGRVEGLTNRFLVATHIRKRVIDTPYQQNFSKYLDSRKPVESTKALTDRLRKVAPFVLTEMKRYNVDSIKDLPSRHLDSLGIHSAELKERMNEDLLKLTGDCLYRISGFPPEMVFLKEVTDAYKDRYGYIVEANDFSDNSFVDDPVEDLSLKISYLQASFKVLGLDGDVLNDYIEQFEKTHLGNLKSMLRSVTSTGTANAPEVHSWVKGRRHFYLEDKNANGVQNFEVYMDKLRADIEEKLGHMGTIKEFMKDTGCNVDEVREVLERKRALFERRHIEEIAGDVASKMIAGAKTHQQNNNISFESSSNGAPGMTYGAV